MTPADPSDEWWKSYFDEDFYRIYQALLPDDDARDAVEAVMELASLSSGDRVLDLACGWGRHATEFARSGIHVVAMDRALPLLRLGIDGPRGDRIDWVCGDLRALPFRRSFDAVVCLFSSLGYFEEGDEDLRALLQVGQVLQPDGVFILETTHRDMAILDYEERDWWEGEAGERIFVERQFDAVAGVTHEWLRWHHPDGSGGEKYHSARIRSATEWKDLLILAGFDPIGWYGGWDGSPFERSSERLVIVAVPA